MRYQVQDNMSKDKVGKCSLRTNSWKLLWILGIYLDSKIGWKRKLVTREEINVWLTFLTVYKIKPSVFKKRIWIKPNFGDAWRGGILGDAPINYSVNKLQICIVNTNYKTIESTNSLFKDFLHC